MKFVDKLTNLKSCPWIPLEIARQAAVVPLTQGQNISVFHPFSNRHNYASTCFYVIIRLSTTKKEPDEDTDP
jgi:hypothetical protein